MVAVFFILSGLRLTEKFPIGQAPDSSSAPSAAVQVAISPQVVTNTVVKTMTWETVEAPDYLDYIDNLRRIGCPEETIRDIILTEVNKLYKAKRREVVGQKKFE